MNVTTVKSKLPSFLLDGYRRSAVLQWLRGLTLRNHWREIHTRDSCIYGSSLRPFLVDLIGRIVSTGECEGRIVEHFESALASILGVSHLMTFSSGRNSLRAILNAMEIREGDEVVLPGFTCVAVPYTILQCGATPVYVDIGSDYRMHPDLLRASLTHRTKAIIAQHTFGLPERTTDIMTLARERGIRVIEDCAHVLPGAAYDGQVLGTWGDAAYFSFERGKTISSGWGGAAVTCDETIGRALCQIKQGVPALSRDDNWRIGTQLFLTILLHHPDLFALGDLVRRALARRAMFPNPMPPGERRGDPPDQLLGRLADTQATLLLCQIQRLSAIAEHRRSCVRALSERLSGRPIDLPLMWYPFQVADAQEAVKLFRSHQIELRRWDAPLSPANCDTARARYQWGSCPTAEQISRGCVGLPTMLRRADLEWVVEVASGYLDIARVE
jgi:perosamine synthetase